MPNYNTIERKGHLIVLVLIIIYFLMYIFLGQDSVIRIHDNLDSELSFRLLPLRSGTLFKLSNNAIVYGTMNGIPRNAFNASSTNIISLLFYFFEPFNAYLINFILTKLIAFVGIVCLLKRFVFKNEESYNLYIYLIAFAFILLPSYTIYGITVLGLPMLLWSILNILNDSKVKWSFLFIVLYPFYSSLILGGFAIILIILLTALYFFWKKDKRKFTLLTFIGGLLIFLYIFSEINIINNIFFDKEFISHRSEWNLKSDITLIDALKNSKEMFFNGQYHSPSYQKYILIFSILTILIHYKKLINDKRILLVIFSLVVISLFYGFYELSLFNPLKEKIGVLKTFQFQRIHFINPFLWYLLLALIVHLGLQKKITKLITVLFLLLNIYYVGSNNKELRKNIYNITHTKKRHITYREFFAEDLFIKVKNRINRPIDQFNVIGLGVFPSVLQYNDFQTLDSYQNNYSLEYKKKFRRIIEKEISKSDKWQNYFDNWGNRCYLFAAELENKGFFIINDLNINLEINSSVLKEMGAKYILSAVEINNPKENGLILLDLITDDITRLKIYIYEIE